MVNEERPYRIDLRSVDELVAHERQAQREDRERLGGLRAAFFLVFSCICGVMAFGLLVAAACTATH